MAAVRQKGHLIKRLVIPDSHGQYINRKAARAAICISKYVIFDEIVFLGDQLDASGLFNKFSRQYISDRYDFRRDVDMANEFEDDVIAGSPNADIYHMEGNHEHHVERWIADKATSDTEELLDGALNPYALLRMKEKGITYIKRSDQRDGMSVRGVLVLDGCMFMHGAFQSVHATYRHAEVFGGNICHGHTHRAASVVRRRPSGETYGGYCPGTLAEFAPLYQQTTPESWSHGVGLQFVDSKKNLNHYNVAIHDGKYLLP